MSAHVVFIVVAAGGIVLCAWILRFAHGEVEAAALAWNDSRPDAAELRPVGELLAFAAAHVRRAPRGAEAVMRSYCEAARNALDRAARFERLAQARARERTPAARRGRSRGLPLRLLWLQARLACSAWFDRTSQVARLAAELAKLDTDVRDELAVVPPRQPSLVTHV